MSIFGSIIQFFIVISIIQAIVKWVKKNANNGTGNESVNRVISTIREEIDKNRSTTPTVHKSETTIESGYERHTSIEGRYSNADELYQAGIISKEEYKQLKK